MSNAVKTLVSIAVAIAIPFAAPSIAAAIGASTGITAAVTAAGMSATVASTLGTAAVGAALGATKAAIFGEDIGRGALMGGISGGAAGYATAPTAAADAVSAAGPPASSAMLGQAPSLGSEFNQYLAPQTTVDAFGQVVPYSPPLGANYMTAGYEAAAGLNTATAPAAVGTGAIAATGFTPQTTVDEFGRIVPSAGLDTSTAPTAAVGTGTGATTVAGTGATTGTGTITGTITGTGAETAATSAAGETLAKSTGAGTLTYAEALAKVPATIAAKFTDPATLADMVLRAGGSIAGSVIAGDGLSSEEKTLLTAQTNELRELQKTNKELFDQKIQQAQNLIGESKYFDPEYFGLQRARRAQLAGAKAKAGLRGLKDNRRASEERRIDLATSRDVGTGFDQGYLSGVEGRVKTQQAGLSAMPGYLTGSGGEYKNIYEQYGAARKRASEESKGIGDLFGSLTGIQKSKSLG